MKISGKGINLIEGMLELCRRSRVIAQEQKMAKRKIEPTDREINQRVRELHWLSEEEIMERA